MTNGTDRLVSMPEVRHIAGLSRPEIYRRMKRPVMAGGFPVPVKVGRRSLWRLSELMAWIDAQARLQPAA